MTDIDYLRIVKWVLIVLAAGFVGQFGKSLASYLIQRARAAKARNSLERGVVGHSEEPSGGATPASPETKAPQTKTDKKAAKALVKIRKKENK